MSNGGAQFWTEQFVKADGTIASGVQVYHYAVGTLADKTVWIDEEKNTIAPQPITGDSAGRVSFYGDGEYRIRVIDSDGILLYDWPYLRITKDTATMWEDNNGTAYPSATAQNAWQLFAKHTAGGALQSIGINTGTSFQDLWSTNLSTPWLDVSESPFFASCDGTTDDASAVQAAIDALPSTGGTILIPGLCGIGAAGLLINNKSDVTIIGMGGQAGFKSLDISTQTSATFGSTVLAIKNSDRCRITGLYMDGNSFASNLIGVEYCTGVSLDYNTLVTAGNNGAVVAAGNTRNKYHHNNIKDGGGTARGMWIGNTNTSEPDTDPTISFNTVSNMGATGIGGVWIGGVVTNNHSISNVGSGITPSASSTQITVRTTIANNICRGNTFSGIQSDSDSDATILDGLTITGNVVEENLASGIYVVRVSGSVVSGNVCRNNNFDGTGNGRGIEVDRATRVSLTGNTCYDTRVGASRTQSSGISVTAQVAAGDIADVALTGNIVYNNLSDGISVQNSGSGTIDTISLIGNMSTDNGGIGINISDVAAGDIIGVTVVGNTMSGNTTTDLRVDPPDAVIGNNAFVNSASASTIHTFTSTDTTPSVKGRTIFSEANASPTTITTFLDGVRGQQITIIFTTSNTTIAESGNIKLASAFTSTADDVMQLIFNGTNWYEISRSVN